MLLQYCHFLEFQLNAALNHESINEPKSLFVLQKNYCDTLVQFGKKTQL